MRLARALSALATAAVCAAAVPPAAAAAAGGTTSLSFDGPAARALRKSGVRIEAVKPAKRSKGGLRLPVAAGLIGSETTLVRHLGGLRLAGGKGRKLGASAVRLTLSKRSRLSAKLGGETIDLFRVTGSHRGIDPGTGALDLGGLRLRLTGAARKAIAERFGTTPQRGRFGTLSISATGLAASGQSGSGGGEQGKASSGCPLPGGAGPVPEEPLPVATKPPAAADVASATLDWHVRESFIRYIATGEGTSASGGATADPPVLLPGASAALSYDFHFPFASGWHDGGANLGDPADDRGAIYFDGALRFRYSAHGIDLLTAAPEIEIAGAASRAIFTVTEGAGSPQRQVLVNLDLSRAASIAASGNTHTYERVPGAVPAGTASSVFAGFYAPGTELGCFSFSYTTG